MWRTSEDVHDATGCAGLTVQLTNGKGLERTTLSVVIHAVASKYRRTKIMTLFALYLYLLQNAKYLYITISYIANFIVIGCYFKHNVLFAYCNDLIFLVFICNYYRWLSIKPADQHFFWQTWKDKQLIVFFLFPLNLLTITKIYEEILCLRCQEQ